MYQLNKTQFSTNQRAKNTVRLHLGPTAEISLFCCSHLINVSTNVFGKCLDLEFIFVLLL